MAVVAGNWKMHHGPSATAAFLEAFERPGGSERHEVVLFPPTVSLRAAAEARGSEDRLQLGVQNVHWEEDGAFTGEVSVGMAAEAGASFALVGHSERRHLFGETDEEVGRKVASVQAGGLAAMACVGETLGERKAGRVDEVIVRQLDAVLDAAREHARLLIAYEPVWAIGTGETATPDDASAAHATLRRRLEERWGGARAARVDILYGGSVKPGNAAELLSAEGVDGVLVGGASLDPDSFAAILAAAG